MLAALGGELKRLDELFEMVTAGRERLELEPWLKYLRRRLMLSTLTVRGHPIRLTESQARWAFLASASSPLEGLLPSELPSCIARTACDKYKGVVPMTPGSRVRAFLANLLDRANEEDVVPQ